MKSLLQKLTSCFARSPRENDFAQLTLMFKPYITESFIHHFNAQCESGMDDTLFTDLAPFRLVPLSVAPLIASYTCRWGLDEYYKTMVVQALASTGASAETLQEMEQRWGGSEYLRYIEEAIRLISSQRANVDLEVFLENAKSDDSPLVALYLHACVLPEVAHRLAVDDPIRRFARQRLDGALDLVRARERFCSSYPKAAL